MEGIVTNIQRYSLNDGDGIRTIVFFKGCPLRCAWCANPETQKKEPQILLNANACMGCGQCRKACPQHVHGGQGGDLCVMCFGCVDVCPMGAVELLGRRMSVADVMEEVEKDRPFYQNSGGGMTLSGGEALFQPAFAKALLEEAGRREIHCAIETAGFADTDMAMEIFALCDQILFDVKHMDPEIHKQYTGVGNEQILRNLKEAARRWADRVIIRVPLIDGVNCTAENLDATAALCKELGISRIDLLPYHELGVNKYTKLGRTYTFDGKTPDTDQLTWASERMEQAGLLCRVKG